MAIAQKMITKRSKIVLPVVGQVFDPTELYPGEEEWTGQAELDCMSTVDVCEHDMFDDWLFEGLI